MQLKNVIDSPCGVRYVLDELELQSGYSRRWLLERPLMTDADEIVAAYALLRQFDDFVARVDATHLNTLRFRLQGLKDIRTTIQNLRQRAILDDIELFEVKHLAILSTDVARILDKQGMTDSVEIPALDEVITILDPDGMKIATFYVYDSYCAELRELRTQMRQHPDRQEELLLQANELELGVRQDLSRQLQTFADTLEQAQVALAHIDVLLAQASQMRQIGLCFPAVSTDDTSHYHGMFHPQVRAALANVKREFQPVDIAFGLNPTLITGANMGGKTVVLKTLTLCQLLFQFGFGIPAHEATIAVKDEIYFCIGDEQSVERGLSSFAAEMKSIDRVVRASRGNRRILALIDEPARTTNPTEGTALVTALLRLMENRPVSLVMTTHYDIDPGDARCLRVKGFENGMMDYTLIEVEDGEAPHEALNIAQNLGIDPEWLSNARTLLNHSNLSLKSCDD